MLVIREVDGFKLNQGDLMAKGLFNVSDENNDVSLWFGEDQKDELVSLSDEDFVDLCGTLISDCNG